MGAKFENVHLVLLEWDSYFAQVSAGPLLDGPRTWRGDNRLDGRTGGAGKKEQGTRKGENREGEEGSLEEKAITYFSTVGAGRGFNGTGHPWVHLRALPSFGRPTWLLRHRRHLRPSRAMNPQQSSTSSFSPRVLSAWEFYEIGVMQGRAGGSAKFGSPSLYPRAVRLCPRPEEIEGGVPIAVEIAARLPVIQ